MKCATNQKILHLLIASAFSDLEIRKYLGEKIDISSIEAALDRAYKIGGDDSFEMLKSYDSIAKPHLCKLFNIKLTLAAWY